MKTGTVDIYDYFNPPRPEGAAGKLRYWVTETSPRVSRARRRPAVLILPGGAYRRTSPREGEPVALRFVAHGWAAFVLDYSCAPLGFPTSLREAALAMRFIRENADQMEIDPHMVAAMGFSAGGHLCGTLGTLYDAPELEGFASPAQCRPDALGLCYPVAVSWGKTHEDSFENVSLHSRALRERLSLDKCVRPDMPPVFLWHTRDDPAVPVRNSLLLAQALDEAGVDFALHVYRHGQHGLSTADELVYPTYAVPETSWDVPDWVDAMLRFFADCGLKLYDA